MSVHRCYQAGGNDMADCGPNGCECKDANSRCLGPIESVGGAEHRISCCALCSITPGCVQWVISSGVDAQEPAMCWLKSKKGSQSASPKRVIGEVDPAYVHAGCPASNWGSTFLLLAGVACGFYVGGGAAYGARIGGSSRPVALQLHPVTLLAVATVHPMPLSALSPSPFGSVRVTCVVPCPARASASGWGRSITAGGKRSTPCARWAGHAPPDL